MIRHSIGELPTFALQYKCSNWKNSTNSCHITRLSSNNVKDNRIICVNLKIRGTDGCMMLIHDGETSHIVYISSAYYRIQQGLPMRSILPATGPSPLPPPLSPITSRSKDTSKIPISNRLDPGYVCYNFVPIVRWLSTGFGDDAVDQWK